MSYIYQGAVQREIRSAADLVHMAAAVETRLTRGTRMNDTSSRSHCVTVFILTVLDGASQVLDTMSTVVYTVWFICQYMR